MTYVLARGGPVLIRSSHLVRPEVGPSTPRGHAQQPPTSRQPSECDQNVVLDRLDLYHKSPDSGERQYTSKDLKKAVCSYPEGRWSPSEVFEPSGPPHRDWYFIAEQPAPAPRLAHPEGCAALRIVLVTVPRVGRSCEHVHAEVRLPRQQTLVLPRRLAFPRTSRTPVATAVRIYNAVHYKPSLQVQTGFQRCYKLVAVL